MNNREKIPGILGGMGPEATVDLMQRILANTVALDDIDHIRCIVDNNPKIPSRMKAILGEGGEDPGPCLAEMARKLEKWGADFLVIPCNTAHHYYEDIARAVSIPVVHLIDLVVEKITTYYPDLTHVGILASTTVIKTKLYESRFLAHGIQVVYPEELMQARLFDVIKKVKAGHTGASTRKCFCEIGDHLASKGIELCVLGCTELGVIGGDLSITSIDAAEVLAQEIVAIVKNGKSLS